MNTYADTSFFFSLYASDAHSPKADAWRQANPLPLSFTAFHRLELRNAFSLAVFQKHLTPQEVQAAWQEVENDLAASSSAGESSGSSKEVTSVIRRWRKPRMVVVKRTMRTVIWAGSKSPSLAERISDCWQPLVQTKRPSFLPKRRALRKSPWRR